MDFAFETKTREMLDGELVSLENKLNGDLLYYNGNIFASLENIIKKVVEDLKAKDCEQKLDRKTLYLVLTTPGGDVGTVERIVNIIRHHYEIVNFIIPDMAMSAGTVLALSGDDIFMSYASSLGPIDPQICNAKNEWVPVKGYLSKVEEMLEKARENKLTDVEFALLRDLDLAQLSQYEQDCKLTTDLLTKWLVKYKFKNWNTHNSSRKIVTVEEKEKRATEIAEKLGDNSIWLSHGRFINIQRLQNELGLIIQDYGTLPWCEMLETYCEMIQDYHQTRKTNWSLHTRTIII